MRRVYVFSIPVRLFHWINVAAMIVLVGTGLIIGAPLAIQSSTEASYGFWFGWVRYLHFVSAYVFTANFVFRIYMMFAGSKFENWRNFVPTTMAFVKEIIRVLKVDILLMKGKSNYTLGHNALAGFSYFFIFLLMAFQIFTGFALYAAMTDSWVAGMFTWVTPLIGSDADVRFWHHVATWAFVVFTIIHVYLVVFHDVVEGRGETSAIVGGWKFIEEDIVKEHDYVDDERIGKKEPVTES